MALAQFAVNSASPTAMAFLPTVLGLCACSKAHPEETPRHLLLITVDTTRADHLFCYGYSNRTTPNIDRLASRGVLFKNAYSAAPITLPSHATILTGTYPFYHGARTRGAYQVSALLEALVLLSANPVDRLGARREALKEIMRAVLTGAVASLIASVGVARDAADLGPPIILKAGGKPIDVTVGHAAPYVFDMDGDGRCDLLVGEFGDQPYPGNRLPAHVPGAGKDYNHGRLGIYRNVGTDSAPVFDGFEYLRAGRDYAAIPST